MKKLIFIGNGFDLIRTFYIKNIFIFVCIVFLLISCSRTSFKDQPFEELKNITFDDGKDIDVESDTIYSLEWDFGRTLNYNLEIRYNLPEYGFSGYNKSEMVIDKGQVENNNFVNEFFTAPSDDEVSRKFIQKKRKDISFSISSQGALKKNISNFWYSYLFLIPMGVDQVGYEYDIDFIKKNGTSEIKGVMTYYFRRIVLYKNRKCAELEIVFEQDQSHVKSIEDAIEHSSLLDNKILGIMYFDIESKCIASYRSYLLQFFSYGIHQAFFVESIINMELDE